jgi:hypothetical protein
MSESSYPPVSTAALKKNSGSVVLLRRGPGVDSAEFQVEWVSKAQVQALLDEVRQRLPPDAYQVLAGVVARLEKFSELVTDPHASLEQLRASLEGR